MSLASDRRFLDLAFALARRVDPRETSPNPRVGCVLVKGGRVIARGVHHGYGRPHAEPTALARLGGAARGATAFVTMEPCAPYPGKRNPSCAETLAAAGIARVVCASLDPHAKVAGRGLALLRRAGARAVVLPGYQDAAEELNRGFFSRMRRGRPWVILKTALSLDGKASAVGGRSRWVTGPAARAAVHALRAECDAILVGAGTLRADDPALTAHGAGRDPLRVVLKGRRPLPKSARALRGKSPALVLPGKDLRRVLKDLSARGVGTLLVEGGPAVHASFLREGLVDEVKVFLAPKLLSGTTDPNRAPTLRNPAFGRVGDDWLVEGVL